MKSHCLDKRLTKHKRLEIQIGWYKSDDIFDFQINWTTKQDHAGLKWHIEILGYHFIIQIYDHRHWDHNKNEWEMVNAI